MKGPLASMADLSKALDGADAPAKPGKAEKAFPNCDKIVTVNKDGTLHKHKCTNA